MPKTPAPKKKPAGYPKFDKAPVRYGRGQNSLVPPRRGVTALGPLTEKDMTKGVLAHLRLVDSDLWAHVGELPGVPGIVEHAHGALCQVSMVYDYGLSYFEDVDSRGHLRYIVVMPATVNRFSNTVETVRNELSAWLAGVEACVRK